jgi:hypothetical protein
MWMVWWGVGVGGMVGTLDAQEEEFRQGRREGLDA